VAVAVAVAVAELAKSLDDDEVASVAGTDELDEDDDLRSLCDETESIVKFSIRLFKQRKIK